MKCRKFVYMTLLGAVLLGSALVLPVTADQTLQSDAPGSMLIFPIFDIGSGNSTHIRITDVSNGLAQGTTSVRVHLDYICGGTPSVPGLPPTFCDQSNEERVLTDHRTLDIDVAASVPPCTRGFIVAYAVANGGTATGRPVAYDSLIGTYHISYAAGNPDNPTPGVAQSEAANAIAIQSAKAPSFSGTNPATILGAADPDGIHYDLTFGTSSTADYVYLPKVLHGNYRAITASSSAYLILLTPAVISADDNTLTTVQVGNWDQLETNFSAGTTSFVCWEKIRLDAIDSHFAAPPLPTALGSFKLTASRNKPILGAVEELGTVAAYNVTTIRNLYHCPTYTAGAANTATCAVPATYATEQIP